MVELVRFGVSTTRKSKQRRVPRCGDDALFLATKETMAKDLQTYYNDNHHEDDWHNEHDGDDKRPVEDDDDDGDKDPTRLPDAPLHGGA